MQIKAITVNAAGMMPAGAGIQEKKNQMRPAGGMFGPECRVTISQEGRKLSGQQTARSETGNAQSVREERMLLRQQEEADLAAEIREGYREELNEIDEQIKALNASYASWEEELREDIEFKRTPLGKAMKETVKELKNLKESLEEQKDYQTEEAQRRKREARQMAMQQSARCNEEIDENNRDLVALLKTIEEVKKAEDGRENDETEGGSEASGAGGSVSEAIQDSALRFMSSSASREKGVEEMLAHAGESGLFYFDVAEAVTQSVLQKTADIRTALDNEVLTDEQLEEMMQKFREEMELNYKDVKYSRSFGMDVLRTVRGAGIEHVGDDSLRGVEEAKRSMMQSSADAVFGEARKGSLEEKTKELADEVERLIDERNDINKTPEEKKKEREEQEKMQEEMLQPEEEKERLYATIV
mgnify:CR=1 FL=1